MGLKYWEWKRRQVRSVCTLACSHRPTHTHTHTHTHTCVIKRSAHQSEARWHRRHTANSTVVSLRGRDGWGGGDQWGWWGGVRMSKRDVLRQISEICESGRAYVRTLSNDQPNNHFCWQRRSHWLLRTMKIHSPAECEDRTCRPKCAR